MEELKAYIESGVLELYVLGELTKSERRDVELMLEKHPQLKSELAEIEKALAFYAEKQAIKPKETLRDKVMDSLDFVETENSAVNPVINISEKRNNFYKYGFAASVALLLLSLLSIFNLRNELKQSRQQLANLELSNRKFASRVNYIEKQLSEADEVITVLRDPASKMIQLAGTPKAPQVKMTVAFNAAKRMVMIDLSSIQMPKNDASHQYQLWALVNGKPVDLGVFDVDTNAAGMIKMKPIAGAQAFAVTLEPRGGSVNPTLDQMMAMGEI